MATRQGRRAKLTKRTVDAAKPAGERFIVWDTSLPGFGLRVEPSGAKVFVARYRAGGGRTGTRRQATIGRYGTVTADEARGKAHMLLGKAAGGGDPVGDAKAARQAGATVGELCDWYMAEAKAGRLLTRRGRPVKASTLESDRGRIDIHIKPLLGKRAAQSLTVADLEKMQADIAAGRTVPKPTGKRERGGLARGGGGVARRTVELLGAILEHATRHALITGNPARGARKLKGARRTDRLTLDDMRKLGAVLRSGTENATGCAAIRFLALTGLRRNEALSLRPMHLLAEGGVDLTDSKTGPQTRPVGGVALDAAATELRRHGTADWVFPADRGDGHFIGLPKVLARACKAAGLKPITPHALRHSFASIAGELGFSELVIAGLLGHSAGTVTRGYIHLDRALVVAADRISDAIARALDGEEAATVVPLRSEAI